MDDMSIIHRVCIIGFILGAAFGAVAQKSHFCTMGAISDIFFFDDWNRFRAWILAISVAVLGSQLLQISGLVDLTESIYLSPNLGWLGAIVGGLLFGFGMTLGGGCGNKTLVRLGSGNLKSLIVALFIGVFAYMTLRGLVGIARVGMESYTMIDLTLSGSKSQSIPELISLAGLEYNISHLVILVLISGGGAYFCFKCEKFRAAKVDITAGLLIGSFIPIAWYVTGVIGKDEFDPTPLMAFSFIAPVGESLQYLMTFTGSTINFGVAVVGGIIFGSFVASKMSGEFRLEAFSDSSDMIRHISGGGLMGVGGVLALGCTIGQGVSGVSTLSIGSFIALFSIILGGIVGMRYLEEGTLRSAVFGIFRRDKT